MGSTKSKEYKRLEKLADKECSPEWTEYHWRQANQDFLEYKIKHGYEEYSEEEYYPQLQKKISQLEKELAILNKLYLEALDEIEWHKEHGYSCKCRECYIGTDGMGYDD